MNGLWYGLGLIVLGLVVALMLGLFNGMSFLLGQLLLCLLLAALLGMLLGMLIGRLTWGRWRLLYDNVKGRIDDKDRDLERLKVDLASRTGELEQSSLRVGKLESDLTARNNEFATVQARLAESKADLDASRLGRSDLEAELAARTQALAASSTRLAAGGEASSELASLKTQLEDAKAKQGEVEKLQAELKQAEVRAAEAASLQAELEALKTQSADSSELNMAKGRQRELETELSQTKASLEALQRDLNEKDKALTEAKEAPGTVSQNEAELESLRTVLKERENQITNLSQQLSTAQTSADASDGLKAELDEVKANLARRNKRIAELEGQIGERAAAGAASLGSAESGAKEDSGSSSESDNNALLLQLSSLQSQLASRDSHINDLQGQLKAKEGESSREAISDEELRQRLSQRYTVQEPTVKARFLGPRLRLSGAVPVGVRNNIIARASERFGEENIIDDLSTDGILAAPEWTRGAFTAAINLNEDLKDAHLEATEKSVRLSGIVDTEAVKLRAEQRLTNHLGEGVQIDNNLQVLGKDIEGDDLKDIKGIETVLEPVMHGIGVYTFKQIASWTPEDIEQVKASLAQFRNRIEREDWIGQSKALHKEKYGEDL